MNARLAIRVWRIGLAVVATACSLAAFAHTSLDHASPRVGSSVDQAPAQVTLWFNEEIDSTSATVAVFDKEGRQVDRGDAQVDASDRTKLQVSLPPLGAGTYRVRWRAASADKHVSHGSFTFRVAR